MSGTSHVTSPPAVLRSVTLQGASKFGTLVATLAAVSVATRGLGTSAYGVYALVGVFVAAVTSIGEFGLPVIVTRELGAGRTTIGDVVGTVLVGRLVTVVPIFALGLVLATVLYGDGAVQEGVALAMLGLFPAAISSTLASVFQVRMQLQRLAGLELAMRLTSLVALVLVLRVGGRVDALLASGVALGGVQTAATWWLLRRDHGPDWNVRRGVYLPLVRKAAPLGFATGLNIAYLRFDAMFIAAVTSVANAGRYLVAYRCMESCLLFAGMLTASVFPALSKAAHDPDAFVPLMESALRTILLVTLPFAAIFAVLGSSVTRAVGGAPFGGAGTVLSVLSVATLASAVNILLGLVIVALDRQAQMLWLNIAVLTVNVVLNVLLVPTYGITGAAWAMGISEVFVVVVALVYVRRLLPSPVRVRGLSRMCAAAAVAATVAWTLRSESLALSATVLAAVYGIGLVSSRVVRVRVVGIHA